MATYFWTFRSSGFTRRPILVLQLYPLLTPRPHYLRTPPPQTFGEPQLRAYGGYRGEPNAPDVALSILVAASKVHAISEGGDLPVLGRRERFLCFN